MRININEIPPGGLTLTLKEPIESFVGFFQRRQKEPHRFVAPIKSRLILNLVGEMISLEGRLQTQVEVCCSRCLTTSVQDLDREFRLMYAQYRPEDQNQTQPTESEIELTAEDVGLMWFENDIIDTHQAVYEEALAALPLKPLCRPGCKGLCSGCGADLNVENCTCTKGALDPRFAALEKLKLDDPQDPD